MAYNEKLADRLRELIGSEKGISEKKMFGGLAFLMNGKMSVGVIKDNLVVRVGKEQYEDVLKHPAARPMDFTGKPIKSMVYVDAKQLKSDADYEKWIELGMAGAANTKKRSLTFQ